MTDQTVLYFRDLTGGEVAAIMRYAGVKDVSQADVGGSIDISIGIVWAFEKRTNPDLTVEDVAGRRFTDLTESVQINMEDEPPLGKGLAVPASKPAQPSAPSSASAGSSTTTLPSPTITSS